MYIQYRSVSKTTFTIEVANNTVSLIVDFIFGMASGTRKKKSVKSRKDMEEVIDHRTRISSDAANMSNAERLQIVSESMKLGASYKYADLAKQYANEVKEAEEETQKMVLNSLLRNMLVKARTFVTDDGDQSAVRGIGAANLKYKWSTGMDWAPRSPFASRWMKCLAAGHYDEMMIVINDETDVKTLVERRETLLNFSALFHLVKGATCTDRFDWSSKYVKTQGGSQLKVYDTDSNEDNGKAGGEIPKHVECMCKLIELGANVQARDFAGFTPLFYCVTQFANPVTLKLASILLKHGAEINARNRIGETALADSVMSKTLVCVKFLLDRGADPTVRCNDGGTAETTMDPYDRDLKVLFANARRDRSKAMKQAAMEEAGGSLKKCEVCDEGNARRCTACFMIRYCGSQCQRMHWPKHKKQCKETRKLYVQVKFNKVPKGAVNIRWNQEGKVRNIKDTTPVKCNFVVKIQIPFDDTLTNMWLEMSCVNSVDAAALTVYNETRSLFGDIPVDDPSYKLLVSKIRAEGVFGDKGFFYAFLDKEGNLKVNVSTILPPRTW